MNTKYIEIMFIAAAFILAGCINPLEEVPPVVLPPAEQYPPPFAEEGKLTTNEDFAANLLSAQNVYLVEDLRNLSAYPISKNNIMQCTVDYAGSPGLVGKTVTIFAFDENGGCQTSDGPTSMADCYAILEQAAEDPDTAIIWIEKGETPEFYPRGLVVGLSDVYAYGFCRIDFAGPAIVSPELMETPGDVPDANLQAGVPEVNETPGSEEEPMEPETGEGTEPQDSAEVNDTVVSGPGDSHTFP